MKKIPLALIMLLINLQLFSQNVNPDVNKLKQENQKLRSQIGNLQRENDNIRKESTALKQDTIFLRKEIVLCSLYNIAKEIETTNTNANYKFSFISCKGNRAAQQVILVFFVEHNLPNQDFAINRYDLDKGNAYDSQGNNYKAKSTTVGGNNGTSGKIPSGVPVKITLSFDNVLPGNDVFKAVDMIYNSYNLDQSNPQKGTVEFRNIKIVWNNN